ncbi:MAG: DUF3108 domain-containing protein [Rhodoferax sp.]
MPQLTYRTLAAASSGPPWRLGGIALGVVLAHGVLLFASPQSLVARRDAVPYAAFHFSTYSIETSRAPSEVTTPQTTAQDHAASAKPIAAARTAAPVSADVVTFEEQGPPDATPTEAIASSDSEPGATAQTEIAHTEAVAASAAQPQASPTPVSTPQPTTSAPGKDDASNVRVIVPPPARLLYDVNGEIKGFPYHVNGELLWNQDGNSYNARLEIRHFLLGSRVQTSTGTLGPQGLEPIRFGDKVKSEVAAHFQRDKGKVSFSANTPDAPLLAGAQDQLSVLVQVAALVAAQANSLNAGTVLSFQAVGPRSADTWRFTVGNPETLTLPGGSVPTLHVWRDPPGEFDPKLEIWLAPEQGYLPVRIRLSQRNGDFVDQLWRETRKP